MVGAALVAFLVAGSARADQAETGVLTYDTAFFAAQRPNTAYDMIGRLGRVCARVNENGVGEMIFARDGARGSIPIRSEDGLRIDKDTEVVITRLEKGIAYVRRWEDLAGDEKA